MWRQIVIKWTLLQQDLDEALTEVGSDTIKVQNEVIEVNDEIDDTGQEGEKKDNSYYEDFLFQRPMGKVHFTSSINPMHFANAANPISLILAVNTSNSSL